MRLLGPLLAIGAALAVVDKAKVQQVVADIRTEAGSSASCPACKNMLRSLRSVVKENRDNLGPILAQLCDDPRIQSSSESLCNHIHFWHDDATDTMRMYSFTDDLSNMLELMDPESKDGDYFCSYMWSEACIAPPLTLNYHDWWPDKHEVERAPLPQSNGRTFKVLHISDIHLAMNYTEHAPAFCDSGFCCTPQFGPDPDVSPMDAPKWGFYRCDCPQNLMDEAIKDAGRRDTFDFALFTGDMVDHNPIDVDVESTLYEEETVLHALKTELGGIPVYPVLGNHDSWPYGQNPPPDSPYGDAKAFNYDRLEPIWADWLGTEASGEIRKMQGAYSVSPRPGLRVITLASNYWYRQNMYNYANVSNPDPSGAIRFAVEELLYCEKHGIRAWLQAHVPFGGNDEEAMPLASALLTGMVERFHETIAGIFFGHTHYDEFTVLYSNGAHMRTMDNAIAVAWVGPSVTPWVDINPAYRAYVVDADTYEIMDSETYFARIDPAFGVSWAQAPPLEWRREYSAREAYGAKWPANEPLNGRFWHLVAAQIYEHGDFSQKFVEKQYRESLRVPKCTSHECRMERYCYATSFSVGQVQECYGETGIMKQGWRRMGGLPTWPMARASRHDFVRV